MKIREGAYYMTRRGLIVGPLTRVSWCDRTFAASGLTWKENGSYVQGLTNPLDIISEVYVSDTPPDAPEAKILRDEFAMAALAGFIVNCTFETKGNTAADIYKAADAMMEARKK
jgi:hypothetical protein